MVAVKPAVKEDEAEEPTTDFKKLVLARVEGTMCEKVTYHLVLLTAVGLFLASFIGVLDAAANETITSFELTQKDELPLPVMWFCFEYDCVVEDGNEDCTDDPATGNDQMASIGFELKGGSSCDDAVMYSLKGNTLEPKCLEMTKTDGGSEFTKRLEADFKKIGLGGRKCYALNEDGKLKKKKSQPGPLKFNYASAPFIGSKPGIEVGFTDPDLLDDPEVLLLAGKPPKVSGYNAQISVQLTMDTTTDLRTSFSFNPPSSEGFTTKKLYQSNMITAPTAMIDMTLGENDDKFPSADSTIIFQFSSFLSRDVTMRHKTGSEIWAEIGGAWAAALVILTFFFLEKGAAGENGVQQVVQIFRFRTPASRKELVKQFAADVRSEVVNQGVKEVLSPKV